jgi:hypothetical protein
VLDSLDGTAVLAVLLTGRVSSYCISHKAKHSIEVYTNLGSKTKYVLDQISGIAVWKRVIAPIGRAAMEPV